VFEFGADVVIVAEGSIGCRAMASDTRSGGVSGAVACTYRGPPGNLRDLAVSVVDTRQGKFTDVAKEMVRAGRGVSTRQRSEEQAQRR